MFFNNKSFYVFMILILAVALVGCAGQNVVPTATVAPTAEPTAEAAAVETEAEAPVEEPTAEAAAVETEAEAPVEETTAEAAAVETEAEAPVEETTAEAAAAETEAEAPVEETTEEAAAAETEAETPAEETTEEAAAAETVAEAPAEETTEEAAAAETVTDDAAEGEFAASVDGEGILLSDFEQMAAFNRYQYLNMYAQYAQMYSMYGMPIDSLDAQVSAILNEEGKERLGTEVLDQLTYNKVLQIEAENSGLQVSDEDVYNQLKTMFGYEEPAAEEEGPMGMESFNVNPVATESDDDRNAAFKAYAENVLNRGYGGVVSFDFMKDYAKNILLDNRMFEASLEDRVFEAEMVSARHILVEDEETAKDILARLEAGEDWAALASENSLDTANKDNSGDLGWFSRGQMVAEFEEAAFALEPGEISEPVKTTYGYHIIASDGKEMRPLSGSALQAAQNAAYDEWALGLRAKHDIQTYPEVWLDAVPLEPAFVSLAPQQETAEAEAVTAEETVAESAEAADAEAEATEAVVDAAVVETEAETAEVSDTEAEVTEEPEAEATEAVAEAAVVETEAETAEVTDTEAEVTEEPEAEATEAVAEAAVVETEAETAEVTDTKAEVTEEPETEATEAVVDAAVAETEAETTAVAETEAETAQAAIAEIPEAEAPSEEVPAENPVVAVVNGEELYADEFVQMATFSRYQMLSSYQQYVSYAGVLGFSMEDINSYFETTLGESGKADLGGTAVDQMMYAKMLDLESAEMGIEVTRKQVEDQMRQIVGLTDSTSEAETSLGLESFNLEAEPAAEDAEDTELRNFVEMDLSMAFDDKISYDFYLDYLRHGMLENAVMDKLMEGRDLTEEQVNARHILVEKEETAKEILAKLEAGEDWDALAAEYSLDEGNKDHSGALGWFGRDVMVGEFEDAAFALEPGEISEPVKTSFGWHIIASDGKEMRPMDEEAQQIVRDQVFDEWYQQLIGKYDRENYPDVWMPLVPMEPAFVPVNPEDITTQNFYEFSNEENTESDANEETGIVNTEQDDAAVSTDNAEGQEVTAEAENDEEETGIVNTEQDDAALLLDNDAENPEETKDSTSGEEDGARTGEDEGTDEPVLDNNAENSKIE